VDAASASLLAKRDQPSKYRVLAQILPYPPPEIDWLVGFLFSGGSVCFVRFAASVARSPSGKAWVCKTHIGGSIPLRASNFFS
jgi:hypothetical protein